jgi:hypothetical protein
MTNAVTMRTDPHSHHDVPRPHYGHLSLRLRYTDADGTITPAGCALLAAKTYRHLWLHSGDGDAMEGFFMACRLLGVYLYSDEEHWGSLLP